MARTCFVIMPIGDLQYGSITLTERNLRQRYDDLIREALLSADPGLEITRADDVAAPGVITTDILTRLMHSDVVVADVTYPNANVFYELGLRHACRTGTIIIKDKNGPDTPFDIAHLRHIPYENTPTGLKELSEKFKKTLGFLSANTGKPDNQFQEVAQLLRFRFPDYSIDGDTIDPSVIALTAVLQSPNLLDLLMRSGKGEDIDPKIIMTEFAKEPHIAMVMLQAMQKSGSLQNPFAITKKDASAAAPGN